MYISSTSNEEQRYSSLGLAIMIGVSFVIPFPSVFVLVYHK
jgi:hypothetical protein